MTKRVDIETFEDLRRHAVSAVVNDMMEGKQGFGRAIRNITHTAAAFGADDADLDASKRRLPSGAKIGTDFPLGNFHATQEALELVALDGLLSNKGVNGIVTEVVQLAALWGRDNRLANLAKEQA